MLGIEEASQACGWKRTGELGGLGRMEPIAVGKRNTAPTHGPVQQSENNDKMNQRARETERA